MKKLMQTVSLLFTAAGLLPSCSTQYLNVTGVAYQSIRSKTPIASRLDVPQDATIIISHQVGENGELDVIVKNNTDKIMVIDRTKSFFQNQRNNSQPYYDPNVKSSTKSTTIGTQAGISVNLGNITNAIGVGGPLGTALGGISINESQGVSTTSSNTTYIVDMPQISVPPHGQVSMGRTFNIDGVGADFLDSAVKTTSYDVNNSFTSNKTYAACNTCIAYSMDDGKTFETINTDLYANSLHISKVKQTGQVNDALRDIYINKRDALMESWYTIYFQSDAKKWNNKTIQSSELLNYK